MNLHEDMATMCTVWLLYTFPKVTGLTLCDLAKNTV
jgi:hypothetical protein